MSRIVEINVEDGLLRECRAAYDSWARFTSSRRGWLFMFLWALGEATVWPIIPDFLLVPMSVGARNRPYRPLSAALLGMALGGTMTFAVSLVWPAFAWHVVSQVPLSGAQHLEAVRSALQTDGPAAYLYQPWSGISFKLWAQVGGEMRLPFLEVVPLFIIGRALRMVIFSTLAMLLGEALKRFVRDYSLFLAVIYLVLFSFGLWQVVG